MKPNMVSKNRSGSCRSLALKLVPTAEQSVAANPCRRIYLETMQEVLPGVQRKVILDEDLKGLLPLLSLDREVAK